MKEQLTPSSTEHEKFYHESLQFCAYLNKQQIPHLQSFKAKKIMNKGRC